MIEINYLAVLATGVVAMILGFLWYGPLFGKTWMALVGMTPEAVAKSKKKGMTASYLMMFIGALITASVFAWILESIAQVSIEAGMIGGFWLWLGFIAPVMLGKVLWEGKSWKLYFIDVSYYLVLLMVFGAILGGWQ